MGGGYGARFECTLRYGEAGDAENSMGGCCGGGARSEGTLRYGEAGDAENSMGGCYGGGARLEGKVCLQMGPEEPNQ